MIPTTIEADAALKMSVSGQALRRIGVMKVSAK